MSDQLVAKLQSYMRRAASHPAVADSEVVLSLSGEYERESVQVDVAVAASFEERRAAEEGWRLPVGVSAEFLKFVGERLIPPRPNQQFQDVSIADLVGQPDRVLTLKAWCIMAATKEDCCSLVEWCCARGFTHDSKGGSFFDFATHFVGVPWTHSYAELVRSLRSLSDTDAGDGEVFFYVDAFVLNLHALPWNRENPAQMHEVARRAVEHVQREVVVVMQPDIVADSTHQLWTLLLLALARRCRKPVRLCISQVPPLPPLDEMLGVQMRLGLRSVDDLDQVLPAGPSHPLAQHFHDLHAHILQMGLDGALASFPPHKISDDDAHAQLLGAIQDTLRTSDPETANWKLQNILEHSLLAAVHHCVFNWMDADGCPAKKPFYSGDNQEDANDRIAGILGTMVCIMMTNPECKFTASQMGDFINNALKCLQFMPCPHKNKHAASLMHRQASVLGAAGPESYARAKAMFLSTKAAMLDAYEGEDHAAVAEFLSEMGSLLASNQDYDEARRVLAQALTLTGRIYGADALETCKVLRCMGKMLVNSHHPTQAQLETAVDVLCQAHAVMCKHLGPEDQGSLETLQWLAYAYQKKGDVAEARRSLQVVVSTMEATLGARHPLLAKSYNNMGGLMFRIRDFAEARKCYLRALEIWEADVKANEEQVGRVCHNLGTLLTHGLENQAEAEIVLNRSLEIRTKLLGASHEDTVRTETALAEVYIAQQKFELALPLAKTVLLHMLHTHGAQHSESIKWLSHVSTQLCAFGEFKKACYYSQCALLLSEAVPEVWGDSRHKGTLLHNAAALEMTQNMFASALEKYECALPLMEQDLGKDSQTILKMLLNMVICCEALDDCAASVPHAKRWLETSKRDKLLKANEEQELVLKVICKGYNKMGRMRELESNMERLWRVRRKLLGDKDVTTEKTKEQLRKVYKRTGNTEKLFKLDCHVAEGPSRSLATKDDNCTAAVLALEVEPSNINLSRKYSQRWLNIFKSKMCTPDRDSTLLEFEEEVHKKNEPISNAASQMESPSSSNIEKHIREDVFPTQSSADGATVSGLQLPQQKKQDNLHQGFKSPRMSHFSGIALDIAYVDTHEKSYTYTG